MTEAPSLEQWAEEFASDLTRTVHAVSPDCDPFVWTAVAGDDRVSVKQDPGTGIPLEVDGAPLLSLKVHFKCCLDGDRSFLAVEDSQIAVYASAKAQGEPIFRYEYKRQATSVPSAHMHVHAHRDAFTYVMAKTGKGTARGKRRANQDEVPSIQDLHFPLGGHRFRPCLEDILEMLIDEFGIDNAAESREALAEGREKWRRTQAKSVVRDDPESAVAVLRRLGYDVTWPGHGDEPVRRRDRLRSR